MVIRVNLTVKNYSRGDTMTKRKLEEIPITEQDWYHAIPASRAARIFPVSYRTLIRWANEGKIAAWKPGREWFVSAMSLIRLCGKPFDDTELLDILPHIV
jgi:hypothetical protein